MIRNTLVEGVLVVYKSCRDKITKVSPLRKIYLLNLDLSVGVVVEAEGR